MQETAKLSKSYRVAFKVTAFVKTPQISPQRIEERMLEALEKILLDHTDPPQGSAFGFIENLSVEQQ